VRDVREASEDEVEARSVGTDSALVLPGSAAAGRPLH